MTPPNERTSRPEAARPAGYSSPTLPGESDTVNLLDDVAGVRAVARRILRADLSPEIRAEALLRLRGRAMASAWPEAAVGAIVAEIGLDHDLLVTSTVGEPIERAARRLRGRGFDSCPQCLRPLSGELEWQSWRAQREAATAELAAREGATS